MDLPPHLAARRTAWAAAVGLAVAAVLAPFAAWQATVLSGWATAATILLLRVWWALMHKDASATRHHAMREDDSRFVADASQLAARVASLVAVGLTPVKAAQLGGTTEAMFTGLSLLSVVLAWAVVHTLFALRYARLWYRDKGGIEFHHDPDPTYRDFAYVAFTIGMTYQVSDTDLTSQAIRSTALRHALLSFLFGSVIIAVTINVVAGLVR